MENLKNFIEGCKSLGVPAIVCFDTLDIYEKGDVVELVKTLSSLGTAAAEMSDYRGQQIASQFLPDGRYKPSGSCRRCRACPAVSN